MDFWVRYCLPDMLMVLSQPFFRQRHAVHCVTPISLNHFDRLTTAWVTGVELEAGTFIRESQPFSLRAALTSFGSVAAQPFPHSHHRRRFQSVSVLGSW